MQIRRNYKALSVLSIIGIAGALVACSSSDGSNEGADGELTKIKAVSQPNGASLPLYIADKLGYFEDEGLDVELTSYPSGPASLAAGASGEWQAGWQGAPPALTGANQFGLIPAGLMMREDANHIMFIRASVLEGSTPAEVLESHKISTQQNSLSDQVMQACTVHLGAQVENLELVPLEGGEIVQALKSGDVDAINSWATPDFELLDDDDYVQVCTAEEAGVAVVDPFVITPDFADEDPEAAAGFLRAGYRANDFINDNFDEAVDYLLEYYDENGISGGRDQAEYEINIRDWFSIDRAIEDIESGETGDALKASADFFVKSGVYDSAPPVDELLEEAKKLLEAAKND